MADYPSKKRYDAENTKKYTLKLNRNTDAALIAWLAAQPNMQGSVKALIRAEIERTGFKAASENEN